MASSSAAEQTSNERSSFEYLLLALDIAQKPAADERELRVRTIRTLIAAHEALKPIFGKDGELVLRFRRVIDALTKSLPLPEDPLDLIQKVTRLARSLEASNGTLPAKAQSIPSLPPTTKSIFVIHGHDELNRRRLVEMLRVDFNLSPIVILAEAAQSRTTIEKFEEYASSCCYAISLITSDDQVTNMKAGSYSQARPNVLFETGWFAGRLGRDRVLILQEEGTRLHSDFDGINKYQFEKDVCDIFRDIQQELKAAGVI